MVFVWIGMLPITILDNQSSKPLYRQLYESIKDSIAAGRLEPGSRLPATRELAGSLGVNRATVSAAYELLESDGLLKGHVGRGSYVADSRGAPAARGSISFSTSRPSAELFPIAEFQSTVEEVMSSSAGMRSILQLGSPGGYAPLRKYLLDEAVRGGLAGEKDDILITSGCQQALDLIQRVFAGNGETVITEDPVYPGIRNLFQSRRARVAGVPVGMNGIEIEALDRAMTAERPRLAIITSTFQNPTGATLPLEARRAISQMSRRHGVLIVENDIYGPLRYRGASLATIRELDERREVLLLRSFSKVAFPGLRVGWMIGPRATIAQLVEAKQWSDLHTDQLSQAVLLRFAESGRLDRHRTHMLATGAERLTAALEACARSLPEGSSFTRPDGGMNIWITLPEPLDAGELLDQARRQNVSYLPGKHFAVERPDPGTLRISFAGLPPESIRVGIERLGRVFSEALERAGRRSGFESAMAMV